MITLKLWNSLKEETRKKIATTLGFPCADKSYYGTYHHNFDFDSIGIVIKTILESCNLQKDGTINVTVGIKPAYLTPTEIKSEAEKDKKPAYTPTGNINVDILAKWNPESKLKYLETLSSDKFSSLSENTILEMVKKTKEDIKIKVSNEWNAYACCVGKARRGSKIYIGFDICLDRTDAYGEYYWSEFVSGKEFRGEYEDTDRYGHPDWHYYRFNSDDRNRVKMEVAKNYVKQLIAAKKK